MSLLSAGILIKISRFNSKVSLPSNGNIKPVLNVSRPINKYHLTDLPFTISSAASSETMVRVSWSRPAKLYMRWVQEKGSIFATPKFAGVGL